MGRFDERCHMLVMDSLQLANTNNVALYDKISVLNLRAPHQETEERLWVRTLRELPRCSAGWCCWKTLPTVAVHTGRFQDHGRFANCL
eukprot:130991-Pleurochrysis_carterae.AAC.2